MGFVHHPRNLDCWMAIKIFQSLAIEFGKGAYNMFFESFCRTLCMMTKGGKNSVAND